MAEKNSITIGHITQLNIVDYKGNRVLTFKMIDKAHARDGNASQDIFYRNKKRFQEGKHYHMVKFAEAEALKPYGVDVPPRGLTLITKRGYLLLVKSFTDDLAWEVQEQLIDYYFGGHCSIPKYINNSQYQALRQIVNSMSSQITLAPSIENVLWNAIRFNTNVATTAKIPVDQFDEAMDIAKRMHRRYYDDVMPFINEMFTILIRDHVCGGVPLTSEITKQWKSKMGCMLPTPRNWQQLAREVMQNS